MCSIYYTLFALSTVFQLSKFHAAGSSDLESGSEGFDANVTCPGLGRMFEERLLPDAKVEGMLDGGPSGVGSPFRPPGRAHVIDLNGRKCVDVLDGRLAK